MGEAERSLFLFLFCASSPTVRLLCLAIRSSGWRETAIEETRVNRRTKRTSVQYIRSKSVCESRMCGGIREADPGRELPHTYSYVEEKKRPLSLASCFFLSPPGTFALRTSSRRKKKRLCHRDNRKRKKEREKQKW